MQEVSGEYPWEQEVSKTGTGRGKSCQIDATEASADLKGSSGAC